MNSVPQGVRAGAAPRRRRLTRAVAAIGAISSGALVTACSGSAEPAEPGITHVVKTGAAPDY